MSGVAVGSTALASWIGGVKDIDVVAEAAFFIDGLTQGVSGVHVEATKRRAAHRYSSACVERVQRVLRVIDRAKALVVTGQHVVVDD